MKNKNLLKPIKSPSRLGFLFFLGDTQGCGTLRCIHPCLLLNHFKRPQVQVQAQTANFYIFDVDYYKNYTFVQFQRAATETHYKIMLHFRSQVQKKYKVPLIYETDDLLIGIPDYNYAKNYYGKNEEWVKKCLEMCDGVICSTEKLKELYMKKCDIKKIDVIPNHLPKFIWGDIFPAHEYYDGGKIKVLWSGSQNHFSYKQLTPDAQGGDFGKELLNFIKKTTDVYDWYFVGACPEELNDVKNKICHVPWKNIFEYPKAVKEIEADIAIAPLIDNEFNSAKSNIKALEFTAIGAAGIYSDVEPYKQTNIRVKTDEEMIVQIERLAGDISIREKVFRKDYQTVRGQIWWEENDNVKKYIETYLGLFGQRLP